MPHKERRLGLWPPGYRGVVESSAVLHSGGGKWKLDFRLLQLVSSASGVVLS